VKVASPFRAGLLGWRRFADQRESDIRTNCSRHIQTKSGLEECLDVSEDGATHHCGRKKVVARQSFHPNPALAAERFLRRTGRLFRAAAQVSCRDGNWC